MTMEMISGTLMMMMMMMIIIIITMTMIMITISGRLLGLWSAGAKRGLMRWRGTGRPGALRDDYGDDAALIVMMMMLNALMMVW